IEKQSFSPYFYVKYIFTNNHAITIDLLNVIYYINKFSENLLLMRDKLEVTTLLNGYYLKNKHTNRS
ncbi:hypothetical protein, partial [Yersinia pestis]|uniref:hypothetical protein n=1 Tax=Yersinia pestis TaxID=632 RepID=UPI001EE42B1A